MRRDWQQTGTAPTRALPGQAVSGQHPALKAEHKAVPRGDVARGLWTRRADRKDCTGRMEAARQSRHVRFPSTSGLPDLGATAAPFDQGGSAEFFGIQVDAEAAHESHDVMHAVCDPDDDVPDRHLTAAPGR